MHVHYHRVDATMDALPYVATTHTITRIAARILCYWYQPKLAVSAGVLGPCRADSGSSHPVIQEAHRHKPLLLLAIPVNAPNTMTNAPAALTYIWKRAGGDP